MLSSTAAISLTATDDKCTISTECDAKANVIDTIWSTSGAAANCEASASSMLRAHEGQCRFDMKSVLVTNTGLTALLRTRCCGQGGSEFGRWMHAG